MIQQLLLTLRRALLAFVAVGLGWSLALPSAYAHLMPEQKGTINVQGDSVYMVISIPFSALTGFDDDRDGLLSTEELQRHHAALRDQVDRRLLITHQGQTGQTAVVNLVHSPLHETSVHADQLIVLKQVRFATLPTQPSIHTDLFGKVAKERELTLRATRGGQMLDAPGRMPNLQAPRSSGQQTLPGEESEVVVLSALRPAHTFFEPRPMVAWRYFLTGAEHVLLGPDHLLFLLTVVVAVSGWRYWLSVITAFTVAHSITLGLSLFKIIAASPSWVEPLIAASIVLVALDSTFRASAATWQRVALVFSFGLLHGLGFASSISALGLDARFQWVSLLGFNLGIEAGQALFLLALVLLMRLAIKLLPNLSLEKLRMRLSLAAAVLGTYWLIERLLA